MEAVLSSVEIARELVKIDTTNPPGNESACAGYLGEMLAKAGLKVLYHEFAPGRAGLVATLAGKEHARPLCLSGHLDTVPLGAAEWSRPPFGAEIHEDRLYGRGACDMKGGVAAMAADGVLPAEATALVVGEPTANRPVLGHKGALWIHALVKGKSAHGSMPEQGLNAISRAAKVVAKLEEFFVESETHPLLGQPTVNVGMISGGAKINMVPDRCELEADVRTVPGQSHAEIMADLQNAVGELAELTATIDAEAVYTEPDNPWISQALAVVAEVSGAPAIPGYVSYFTDASTLGRAMGGPQILLLGPGEAGLAHQTDEWCSVRNIETVSEMYYRLVLE